jgi:hypothetical protein
MLAIIDINLHFLQTEIINTDRNLVLVKKTIKHWNNI